MIIMHKVPWILFVTINASKSYNIEFDKMIVTDYRNTILYHTIIDILKKKCAKFFINVPTFTSFCGRESEGQPRTRTKCWPNQTFSLMFQVCFLYVFGFYENLRICLIWKFNVFQTNDGKLSVYFILKFEIPPRILVFIFLT